MSRLTGAPRHKVADGEPNVPPRPYERETMSWRGAEHDRKEMFNARCGKCGDPTRVPFDPAKSPGQPIMCRNCRAIYT